MLDINEARKLAENFFLYDLDDYTIEQIVSVLEVADDLYYNDEDSFLSDSEYDILRRYAQNTDPTNSYFLGIGSSIRGGKVTLPYQMGSLDQKYEGEIESWITKNNLRNETAVLSDKLDGASAMVVYDASGTFQIAYSRGDGVEGADISRHVRLMKSFPLTIEHDKPLVVRGENIISKANFPFARLAKTRNGKPYKNARNMVSGLMNASENPEPVYDFVDFVAYEIVDSELSKIEQLLLLSDLGFNVVQYSTFDFFRLNDIVLTNYLNEIREDNNYDIDGIVIDVDSTSKRSQMNPTRSTLNPAYSIKYKVADASNLAEAECVDFEINISKHGYLKPRVRIVPVDLVGVTVTWATGFNMKFIKDNKIGPGAKIRITRSGDVIPFIMETVSPSTVDNYDDWFRNKVNEVGDCYWSDTQVDLILYNAANNATVRYEQLVDFFASIEVPHLGEGNMQKIFDMGFETPESVITLTQEDISSLVGSSAIGKKIFAGMKDKLTNIPMYKLMGSHPAFGRGVGVRKMKKLYEAFKGEWEIFDNKRKIISVDGFDEKTANKIVSGFDPFMDFLSVVEPYITIAPYEAPKSGSFSGLSVVFTGFRSKDLEKQVEEAGGKMSTSVSGKTGLLVTNDPDSTSGKTQKARECNVRIISVEALKDML